MRNFWIWFTDWFAYLTLPIVYYTLRIARAPFFWISIKSHKEYSNSDKLLTSDLILFFVIVILTVFFLANALLWALYGFGGLLTLLFMAALFFSARKWYRNKPAFWSWSKKTKN